MKNIKQLKADLAGQIGENAIWDGPLSKEGFPMGKGSSSGSKGMDVPKSTTNTQWAHERFTKKHSGKTSETRP